jgi:2,4-dienoyl-CoA reductase-like NADH-dependent reductase (Old Yellow Enzyme family)/thioredoxin reductase
MKLFEAIKIKNMELRNRIVMAPMGTHFSNKDGTVSEKQLNYYRRRAEGYAGLIIVEATSVDSYGENHLNELGIWDDKFIAGLSRLTESIHSQGAKSAIQIYHPGRQASSKHTGSQPVAPSAIRYFPAGEVPRELSQTEISDLVRKFGDGARRAKDAGFDAVEIHGAHGYLICQFLSPESNRRNDEYGGDESRRARFALEIIRDVREKVGGDFPVFFRFSASEYTESGLTLDETRRIAKLLEDNGIDVVDVSAGNYEQSSWMIQPMMFPRGCLVPLSEKIREVVRIPTIVAGRINDPEVAEQILADGKADLIALGRVLIADPDFPRKAAEGRVDEIRRCVACNTCVDRLMENMEIKCTQNPEVGNETNFQIKPTLKRKKVVVIGGGPGGLEAAIVSAKRGHDVVLYEKEEKIGGKLRMLGSLPGREEWNTMIQFYLNQLDKHKVNVRVGCEGTLEAVKKEAADAVIVAIGSKDSIGSIPGIEKAATAMDVLAGKAKVRGDRIIVVGGGLVGCEASSFLISQGKAVTFLARKGKFWDRVGRSKKWYLQPRFKSAGMEMVSFLEIEEILPKGIRIVDSDERSRFIKGDYIIIDVGTEKNMGLFEELKVENIEVYIIGDSKEPGSMLNAIHEGSTVASSI